MSSQPNARFLLWTLRALKSQVGQKLLNTYWLERFPVGIDAVRGALTREVRRQKNEPYGARTIVGMRLSKTLSTALPPALHGDVQRCNTSGEFERWTLPRGHLVIRLDNYSTLRPAVFYYIFREKTGDREFFVAVSHRWEQYTRSGSLISQSTIRVLRHSYQIHDTMLVAWMLGASRQPASIPKE